MSACSRSMSLSSSAHNSQSWQPRALHGASFTSKFGCVYANSSNTLVTTGRTSGGTGSRSCQKVRQIKSRPLRWRRNHWRHLCWSMLTLSVNLARSAIGVSAALGARSSLERRTIKSLDLYSWGIPTSLASGISTFLRRTWILRAQTGTNMSQLAANRASLTSRTRLSLASSSSLLVTL